MPSEELENLKQQQYKLEKKLTATKHKEKQLEHKLKQLTRSERKPRRCTAQWVKPNGSSQRSFVF